MSESVSVTDIRRLEELSKQHRQETHRRLSEVEEACKGVTEIRVMVRVICAIVVLAVPTATIAIPYMLKNSVQNALIEQGIYKRSTHEQIRSFSDNPLRLGNPSR